MNLTLGFSPCPNDTFIFDALIHHKIDTEGLHFDVFYDDVETLNQKAFNQELDITKLSFHAFAYAINDYELLDAGSALGFGVGPLLISKNPIHGHLNPEVRVGIPGKFTTANFLLGLAYPQLRNKKELLFSEIEAQLLHEHIDLGLIIHENRFTYQAKGLHKVADLGEYWESQTNSPIPLGGIVVKRNLNRELKQKINRVLKKSVAFAFENPKSGLDFIRSHAQEMTEEVMYKHIELYVNQYSLDLGEIGKNAINLLFDKAQSCNLIPPITQSIYLNP